MHKSVSHLPEKARKAIVEALNQTVLDGLDLYTQIKVAHWNLRGPLFLSLHPQLDAFASATLEHTDELAERAVVLGGIAAGTARQVAKSSGLQEYPAGVVLDLDHAAQVLKRFESYLNSLRETREVADKYEDKDTSDMITVVTTAFEKYAWFLQALLYNRK